MTKPELRLSEEERRSGVVFIKSDAYMDPLVPGRLLWVVRHPPSGWSASGTGTTHEDCVEQADKAARAAYVGDEEIQGSAFVMRDLLNETPVLAGFRRYEGTTLGPREPINIDSTLVESGMFDTVAPGVIGYTVEEGDVLFVPFIYAETEGAGDVGRYLDSLPADRTVVVPDVMSDRLAGMLSRRGFVEEYYPILEADPELVGEKIPSWVRRPR